MIELFGCKAQKLEGNINHYNLVDIYLQKYEECKKSGCTPVIVALDETLKEMIDINYNQFSSPEEFRNNILSEDSSNGKKLFEANYKEIESYIDDEEFDIMEEISENNNCRFTVASIPYNDSEVHILYVPTDKPWQVFAWIPFGGWNDCPDTLSMIAQCRYWYEEYGAIPACISKDILDFYLFEPVKDKGTADKIAKEHCIFCSDILDMGGLNLRSSLILNSNVWSFWWD